MARRVPGVLLQRRYRMHSQRPSTNGYGTSGRWRRGRSGGGRAAGDGKVMKETLASTRAKYEYDTNRKTPGRRDYLPPIFCHALIENIFINVIV